MQTPNATVALIVRAVLSLAFLGFGFVNGDPTTTQLITGAVVGYWLREGEGQALRRTRRGGGRGAHDGDGAASTTTEDGTEVT